MQKFIQIWFNNQTTHIKMTALLAKEHFNMYLPVPVVHLDNWF